MFDGLDLVGALEETMRQQEAIIESLNALMVAKAQAEYEYRTAKAERMDALRDAGYQAALIADMAKGDPFVADKARARDEANDRYWNRREELQMRRDEASDLRAQIDRMWRLEGER